MHRISIANPYDYPLEFQPLKEAARTVFAGEGVKACRVTLAFVNNPHIHRLNQQFLQHDEPTDVLTFPYSEPSAKMLEGEVVIGYEVAQENAAERQHSTHLELLLYVIHGCLHLCGYTDTNPAAERQMRAKEREYLQRLGLPDIASS
ncbi:MAG: rRNA maturation RNase YbeY [Gemmataceae bacterium]|nr:rRNA maturation RNase YbeY [Gemmata sp.]MDW8197710.1 rRNA maturation RNase YbeY [Gemmataceae bacterium]